jgi:ATP-dependent helicase YprA (DUF1998 family)
MPVNARQNEWPVLYYKFDSEGLLVGFDNDLLCRAFQKLGIIDLTDARRRFLHTLAHMMIKTLPVYCGLDTGMLGERIYYEGNYAAVMIFSREPGEVRLGGIRDTLTRNLREWIDSWDSLIDCPLEDNDADGCHYCTYVANSCCDFNKNLSRRLVSKVFEEFKNTGGSG